jgi:2-C-methyl-D-erythritol 2,4-cyclodiphosphate synthase
LRVGIGYDIHPLVPGRPLVLGGVTIPFEKGLEGHSDGDALLHAVSDALLGAISKGDIGVHFPDTDPSLEGVSSRKLIEKALTLVKREGFELENIDTVVVAGRPAMGPHRERIRTSLAEITDLSPDRIGLKAKSNQGLEVTGKGEAIAVHAVVLLKERGEK